MIKNHICPIKMRMVRFDDGKCAESDCPECPILEKNRYREQADCEDGRQDLLCDSACE